jgi:hypothetical protein
VAEDNSPVKIAIIGVAAYLGYMYLQKSGLWAQWFGGAAGSNVFTDPNSLLAYCQANPSGSATYNNQTATCAQWQAAAQKSGAGGSGSSGSSPTPPSNSAPTPSADDTALAASLVGTAKLQAGAKMNVWQWNYILLHMTPTAKNLNTSNNASEMTAADYVAARKAAGLSGLAWVRGVGSHSQIPYRWLQ